MKRTGNCECGKALCCTHITFVVPRIITRDGEKYYRLRKILIKKEKSKTYLRIPMRCNWLTEDNKCRNYPNRPLSCRKYPENPEDLIDGCTYRFE